MNKPILSKLILLLKNSIIKNISWLFIDKIIRMLGGFFVGIWVARYMQPMLYGKFNYAIALAEMFTAFSTVGLDAIIIRDVVRDREDRHEILGTSLLIRAVSGTLSIIIIQVVARILNTADSNTKLLIGIVSLFTVVRTIDVFKPWFDSQIKSKFPVIADNIAFTLSAIGKIVLILVEADLISFALVMLFEVVIAKMLILAFYKKSGEKIKNFSIDIKRIKKLLKSGWPLIISEIAIMIYMRIDQIMIRNILGEAEIGEYSAALRLSKIWYFIPMAVVASVMPRLIRLQEKNSLEYDKQFQSVFIVLNILSYLIIIPFTFFGTWIVKLLYGVSYINAGPVLSLHAWAGLFVAMGVAASKWLINENLNIYNMYRTFFGAVVNITLNFIFIPRYGIIGGAAATVISQAFASFLFFVFFKKTRSLFIKQLKSLFLIGIKDIGTQMKAM